MKGIDMTERKAIFPANRHALYDKHGYSAAVLSGDLLFVSGQVGSLTDGSAEPDFEQQVRLAFKNLEATLEAAGCTFDNVLDVTTFHTYPQKQFEIVMPVKEEFFGKNPTRPGQQLASIGCLDSTSRSKSSPACRRRSSG
jgi:enamine deaminase RidA (YjgF/YER057c/UK114 family)